MSGGYNPYSGFVDTSGAGSTDDLHDAATRAGIPKDVLASGQIPMLTDQGHPVYVGKDQLGDAISRGYKYESPEQAQSRIDAKNYDNPVVAGALGAARGLTLGLSDVAGRGLGFADAIRKFKDNNPTVSSVADYGSIAALSLATAGLGGAAEGAGALGTAGLEGAAETAGAQAAEQAAGKTTLGSVLAKTPAGLASSLGHSVTESVGQKIVANTVLKSAAASLAGGAVEGSLYGAGQGVSEAALNTNDTTPEAVAETILTNAGMGAVIGAGTGFVLGGATTAAGKATAKIHGLLGIGDKGLDKAAAQEIETGVQTSLGHTAGEVGAEANLGGRTQIGDATGTISDVPDATSNFVQGKLGEANLPQSLDEIVAREKAAEAAGDPNAALPSADRLREAVATVPELDLKPTNLDYKILESDPTTRDVIRNAIETVPSEEGNLVRKSYIRQNNEINGHIENTVDSLGSGRRLDPLQSGQRVIDGVRDVYEKEQSQAGELFSQFKDVDVPHKAQMQNLVTHLGESAPAFGNSVEVVGDELKLKPFDATSGLSPAEHSAFGHVVDALNNNESLSVQKLQNIREFLRDLKNPENPLETKNIESVRKAMLDHIVDLAEGAKPDLKGKVREAFVRYAKNESYLDEAEKLFGGRIDGPNALKDVKPENVLKRVFSSSTYVDSAKRLLGDEKFNDLLGDHLKNLTQGAFDTAKQDFSGAKLAGILKREEGILTYAGGETPLKKLQAFADIKKVVTQTVPLNPSGTAKASLLGTALRAGKKAVSMQFGDALHEIGGTIQGHIAARQAVVTLNQVLKGAQTIERATVKNTAFIQDSIQKFLGSTKTAMSATRGAVVPVAVLTAIGAKNVDSEKQRMDFLADLTSSPDKLADVLGRRMANLHRLDSATGQATQALTIKAVSFLMDKAPKNPFKGDIFSQHNDDYRPSDAELAKWNRYFKAVSDPLSILEDMHARVLTPEAVEAVRTVFPLQYQKISQEAFDGMSKHKGPVSFADKIQLSTLLGMPVTSALSGDFIQTIQGQHQSPESQGEGPADAMENQGGAKPSLPGMRNMHRDTATETETQRIMNRGSKQ